MPCHTGGRAERGACPQAGSHATTHLMSLVLSILMTAGLLGLGGAAGSGGAPL